ncbi:MAG: S8 family serine peptidase [Candidatus Saelkia tenebricola]|nr:S8 family serine peptidase [Candidatus Saelkia tenebricola]
MPVNAIKGEIIVTRVIYRDRGEYDLAFDLIEVDQGKERETIALLKDTPGVVEAESNIKIKVQTAVSGNADLNLIPIENLDFDPSLYLQQGLLKLDILDAWGIEKGSDAVNIAVIDTGCDLDHIDLVDNLDINASYDYVNDDDEPQDDHTDSHGTHIAGIIAAVGGNGYGIHGVMNESNLMILKVLDQSGGLVISTETDAAKLAQAITDAIENDAKIINMSWGTTQDMMAESETLNTIFKAVFKEDILIVSAAGNDKGNGILYPAKYQGVLCIAGTDLSDKRWIGDINVATGLPYESAYGKKWISQLLQKIFIQLLQQI